jgi:asparagine synthase (glutamine-hydrolysing)
MCGITGFHSSKPLSGQKMLETLHHRGPDDSGFFEQKSGSGSLFLGHRRLSIIDLSPAGHQPMLSPDGKVVLTFNGEIYNFKELRQRHLPNVRFKSDSDSEVVLYLYLKFGIGFIQQLNGDFAIALFDANLNKLFLIRDRLGVKPLYYFKNKDSFIYASELKAILASGLDFSLAADQLENYFVFKYQPLTSTLISGIQRLTPAHFLEYDLNTWSERIQCYWDISESNEPEFKSYTEAVEQLRSLVGEAIHMQLMSDVPVGTFFSGGVDSSIMAGFLKDHSDIRHYTAQKNEADLAREGSTSDYHFARELAGLWHLNLFSVDISAEQINPELINQTIYFSDDLIADGSQIPSFLITKQASQHSRVMLSGMGADELFLGYPGHQISLISHYLDQLPRFVRKPLLQQLTGLQVGKGHFKAYKRFLQKLGKYQQYGSLSYGYLNIVGDYENSLSVMSEKRNSAQEIFSRYFNSGEDTFTAISRFERENFLVKNLHYVDRMAMANSIEGRVPFLDYRIAEFAWHLPRKFKLSGTGVGKRILKDAFRFLLPAQVINRRKAGFGMPLRSIFADRNLIQSLLDLSFFSDLGYFSIENINGIVGRHIAGNEDNSALIYALISFQQWYKMFIDH